MRKKLPGHMKLVYLTVGVVCLLLGVVGLIIPIIPGILFLAAALYLLSRASRRIHRFTRSDPRLREWHDRMERFGDISPVDRVRLGGWMIADAFVKSAATAVSTVRRVWPRQKVQGYLTRN